MLSLILVKKIASLLVIMLLGAVTVKTKILKPEDSKILSVMTLWVIGPCMIISNLQIDITPDITRNLLVSFVSALLVHSVFLLVTEPVGKGLRLTKVERECIAYPNCGNMVIPLVTAMFGQEMVFYVIPFICASVLLQWTHLYSVMRGEKPRLRNIFTNVNIISIALGVILLLLKVRLPFFIKDAALSVGEMIGPVSMFITGMLLGNQNLKRLLLNLRAYAVSVGRLVVMPLVALAIYKLFRLENVVTDSTIIMISFLSSITCSASTVTQMADLYTGDGEYAATINILTTLLCIITAPLMVLLFQLWKV